MKKPSISPKSRFLNVLLVGILLFLLNLYLIFADMDEFTETKKLIDSGISCDRLTDEQLEAIGDYYMEQMHPGRAHEMMDKMMGGEGSESLKQVHINMAKRLYCNQKGYIGYGMMGSSGMMNMMGGYSLGYGYANGYWNIFLILLFIAVIFLIVWTVYISGIKKTASVTPLNILKNRFAKGEITKKEFDDIKKEIEE